MCHVGACVIYIGFLYKITVQITFDYVSQIISLCKPKQDSRKTARQIYNFVLWKKVEVCLSLLIYSDI